MLWAMFPPAVRSGGPARSAAGILAALADEFEFFVITSAFDGTEDPKPMEGVNPDCWERTLGAQCWYSSHRHPSPRLLIRLIRECDPQVVYLNSLWNVRFSIFPLLALRLSRVQVPVLLAPRGELSKGALRIRPWRKRAVISAYRVSGLARRVAWHVSTELDRADVHRVFGPRVVCHVATDLRANLGPPRQHGSVDREDGEPLRAVFLSRITPKKNLDGLLRALSLTDARVDLTIAGPVDDPEHWRACERLIEALPPTTRVLVHGAVEPASVVEFLCGFDLFLLPTHGENFGHAILEALAAGLPVIVGRDTPWRQVEEEQAGWLVDSDSLVDLAQLIDRFAALAPAAQRKMGESAAQVARAVQESQGGIDSHRSMFLEVASQGLEEQRHHG